MNIKTKITSTIILFGMTVNLMATVPYWNIDNLGIPNPLPNSGDDGFQLNLYPPGGAVATNGTVFALGNDQDYLYLASWTLCSGWSAIATFTLPPIAYEIKGSSPGPLAICLGGNGDLYVGGEFIAVTQWPDGPTVNATNIAVYNLNSGSWSGLGDAVADFDTNPVTAIAVDSNQKVYIATYPVFSKTEPFAPLNSTDTFMEFSNSQWVCVGGGMEVYQGYTEGFPVDAMVASGTDIYLAGDLLGGYDGAHYTMFVSSTNIIRWKGASNAWQAMGAGDDIWGSYVDSGGYNSEIYSLAVLGTNVFIAGGWASGMGEGSQPGPGYGLGIFSTNGTLVGGGTLLNSGCGYQNGLALVVQNGSLFVGGDFEYIGNCTGTAANGIAMWTNSEWYLLTNNGVQNYNGSYSPGTVNWLAADANALYVFGAFNVAGGLATTNVARYLTKNVAPSVLDPCQKTWPLVDINFENYENPPMSGPAVFGFSSDDYWNLFEQTGKCISQPYTNLNNLTNVFGYETGIGISIDSTGEHYGSGTTSGSTIRLLTNFCYSSCNTNAITLIITNLPSVQSSGSSGAYDIYLYGYGGTTTISGTEYSVNAQFTISPSGTNVYGDPVTTLTTSSAIYDINTWYEGSQYVLFPNVPISSGSKLEITVTLDPSSPVGQWAVNGIQIVPYPYYP